MFAKEEATDSFDESGGVSDHFGGAAVNLKSLGCAGRCRRDLLGGDEEAVARSAKRGTSNKSKHWLVSFVDKFRNFGWLNGFKSSNGIGVANTTVVNVDEVVLS